MLRRTLFFTLLLLLFVHPASLDFSPPMTSAYHETSLRAGPGHTHALLGMVYPGTEVQILERNRSGTWVNIHRVNELGQVVEGWMLAGYLNWSPDVKFSAIPVNETIHDADTTRIFSSALVKLYSAPVIPAVSRRMKRIFARGQQLGNHANVVTKVGDSVSADLEYLTPMSRAGYDLGPYDDLEDTLNFFGASTAESSIASRLAMTSVSVFDPMWSTDERCEPGETPLACEYRVKKPAVAIIYFGANDMKLINADLYKQQIRAIIHESFTHGVIPVLCTFSFHEDTDLYWQGIGNNVALVELAQEYQVPLIHLYAATRVLPNYGLEVDNIHFKHSGFETLKYSSGHEVWYGTSLQNLLALRMLDEIRKTVGL